MDILHYRLSFHFRHSCLSSALGVPPQSHQEAQVLVHGQLGESERRPLPFPRSISVCRSLGKAQKQTFNDIRQGGSCSAVLLQERHSGAGRRQTDLQIQQEITKAVHGQRRITTQPNTSTKHYTENHFTPTETLQSSLYLSLTVQYLYAIFFSNFVQYNYYFCSKHLFFPISEYYL